MEVVAISHLLHPHTTGNFQFHRRNTRLFAEVDEKLRPGFAAISHLVLFSAVKNQTKDKPSSVISGISLDAATQQTMA